jgi:hypothetical protein
MKVPVKVNLFIRTALRHLIGFSDQIHALAALFPGEKNPQQYTERESGWIPEQVWTLWRREELPAADRNRIAIPRKSRL